DGGFGGAIASVRHDGRELELPSIVARDGNRSADGVVRSLEDFEDAMQRDLEVGAGGKRLADLEKGCQLADFTGLAAAADVHLGHAHEAPCHRATIVIHGSTFPTEMSISRQKLVPSA